MIRKPKLTDKKLSLKDQRTISTTTGSLEQGIVQYSEGYSIKRQIAGVQSFVPNIAKRHFAGYPGNFDVLSIHSRETLPYVQLGDGIVKIRGLGYAVFIGNADITCYLPEVDEDETFYVSVAVPTTWIDVADGIINGDNFFSSVNLLQDELSNSVFYVPLYKMIMKVRTVNEVDTNIYSVIQDLRNMPIL